MQMSSIREVAQLAGVSPATVSRVINGTAQVSEEKRKRILDVIAQTNFVPNEVARSLFKRSAKTIGLIIPSIRNPYFTELAAELDELAAERGYQLSLRNVGYDQKREWEALQLLEAVNADGAILIPSSNADRSDQRALSIPLVVLDSDFNGPVNSYIYCDYYRGAQMAMEHLVSCGCKEIVCIRGPQSTFSGRSRYVGYRDYCLEHGIRQHVVDCDYDFGAGLAMTEALLQRYPRVDGILACNDIVAISTYKILHKRNIPVPEQIQLIGFDDITLSGLISPELTTIRQPVKELARLAIDLVLQQEEPAVKGGRHVLPVSLVVRETTRRKDENR